MTQCPRCLSVNSIRQDLFDEKSCVTCGHIIYPVVSEPKKPRVITKPRVRTGFSDEQFDMFYKFWIESDGSVPKYKFAKVLGISADTLTKAIRIGEEKYAQDDQHQEDISTRDQGEVGT